MKKAVSLIIPPLFLLMVVLSVYWYTKPPSILWIDSGTMIAASASLGIPNPPGFPFYMMASHLATLLPFANILTRLEAFTILFSLWLLFLVYQIIKLIISKFFILDQSNQLPATKHQFTHRSPEWSRRGEDGLPTLAALFGTITLAFSYQYWSQSQNTEAFIFSYSFVALFAFLLLKIETKRQDEKFVFRILLLIAFLYGAAAGANPTVAAMVPGVLYVMYTKRKALSLPKLFILGFVFLVVLTAVYSYLPLRAKTWPFVNWGNPQTAKLFIDHLHGAGLNINEPGPTGSVNGFTGSPLVFVQSVSYFILNSFIQFTPILWPLILIGAYQIFKRSRQIFIILISVPIFNVIYAGLYLSGNQESWFILSWIFFAIFTAVGFFYLAQKLINSSTSEESEPTSEVSRVISSGWQLRKGPDSAQSTKRNHTRATNIESTSTGGKETTDRTRLKTAALFSLCFLPLLVFFIPLNRSGHYYSSDYAFNLYSPLEKNAILIGTGDFFDSLSHYLHEADIYRNDVTPITANVFYVNRWNRDTIRQTTNISISDKLEQMIQYKSFTEYNEVMNQLIDENIDKHPIYVDHLTLRASALAGTTAGQLRLDDRFKFVPSGLSLKVVRASQNEKPNLALYNFKLRSPLVKKPFYFERNYQGAFKNILNNYVYSYESLADWYAENDQDEQALKYYKIAKDLGENAEVLAHLGEFWAQRGDFNASYQYLEKAERLDVNNVGVHFNLGLAYANLSRNLEAIREFESVKLLTSPNDPIFQEAEKMVKQINVVTLDDPALKDATASWQTVKDEKNNFILKIPPEFNKESGQTSVTISDKNPGNLGLNIEIIGEKLAEGQDIEGYLKKSPLIMLGTLLDLQKINFSGFTAFVQIYGTSSGESSQRFILSKNNWLWQFKVYPGNSVKLSQFNKILSTFEPLRR
ncbi:hypothetical protein A3H87_04180 [Candidatus Curtissbacteria bacterium RIFCSPLOWO2_02_FULL_42_37]|nr:MAG: hypothetical protein A3C33_02595 [Candidatus Curtissbacteria bacterium RIFCSPHIGHO2_02_FULL_42_58]OGE11859.1 MAG: hypothetical protein A3H87_04180 [Candidatus Curtissbacteria bacterium RIFCSPLOWO2_02_FULL_42_37]